MAKPSARFDLEERTASLGEAVINFAKTIRETAVTRPLLRQLVRAATSIGGNYCEANDAESKSDFRHKTGICRKESRETGHWLRMLTAALPDAAPEARKLWQEAKELNLIFGAIIRSSTGRRTPPKTPSHNDALARTRRSRWSGLRASFGIRHSGFELA